MTDQRAPNHGRIGDHHGIEHRLDLLERRVTALEDGGGAGNPVPLADRVAALEAVALEDAAGARGDTYTPHDQHTAAGPADCPRCQLIREVPDV